MRDARAGPVPGSRAELEDGQVFLAEAQHRSMGGQPVPRHLRSNGRRQRLGAISASISFGPQDPGA
jgi:hypothetical protein